MNNFIPTLRLLATIRIEATKKLILPTNEIKKFKVIELQGRHKKFLYYFNFDL
jgi:hypothetical protein